MDYVKAMENGWDEVQFAVEAFDWKNASYDQAKEAALRVIDQYDFKDKQPLHRDIIQYDQLDSVRAIHKFCRDVAWSGAKIKWVQKFDL